MNNELRYYLALKRIASYESPDQLRRGAEGKYGLPFEEALEYAYENVIEEARAATKGKRRPKDGNDQINPHCKPVVGSPTKEKEEKKVSEPMTPEREAVLRDRAANMRCEPRNPHSNTLICKFCNRTWWFEHATRHDPCQGKLRWASLDIGDALKEIDRLRASEAALKKWVNLGGAPSGTNCLYEGYDPHEIYGPGYIDSDGDAICATHYIRDLREQVAALIKERDAHRKHEHELENEIASVCAEDYSLKETFDALSRAEQRIPPGKSSRWAILFDDPDCETEVFIGEGSEKAARERFAQYNANWTCYLFTEAEPGTAKESPTESSSSPEAGASSAHGDLLRTGSARRSGQQINILARCVERSRRNSKRFDTQV